MATTIPSPPTGGDFFPSPFPARSRTANGLVNGVDTHVSCMYFADKIMVTISQGGRLGQWIQIPLTTASPTSYDTGSLIMDLPGSGSGSIGGVGEGNNMILPTEHLTPRTLIGAGGEERERIGHLWASQVASMVLGRNPEERRGVLVGLGLEGKGGEGGEGGRDREGYFDLLELVAGVL